MFRKFELYNGSLQELHQDKLLINTLNAHSFNTVRKDPAFLKALQASDILLPDGISVVLSARWLQGKKIKKIAGNDLLITKWRELTGKVDAVFFLAVLNQHYR